LVGIIILFLVLAVGFIQEGFVLIKLWNWFALPLFPNLPILNIPQAIGISILLGFLTHQYMELPELKTTEEKGKRAVSILIRPWVVLLFGYIVSRWL
jgi:hypothetical protein